VQKHLRSQSAHTRIRFLRGDETVGVAYALPEDNAIEVRPIDSINIGCKKLRLFCVNPISDFSLGIEAKLPGLVCMRLSAVAPKGEGWEACDCHVSPACAALPQRGSPPFRVTTWSREGPR